MGTPINLNRWQCKIVPAHEKLSRADYIVDRIKPVGLGEILAPTEHTLKTASKVHRKDYLDFLPTVWNRWTAERRTGTALPFYWPTRGMRADKLPDFNDGLLGYYSFVGGAGFTPGTWMRSSPRMMWRLLRLGWCKTGKTLHLRIVVPFAITWVPFYGWLLPH
jgi:acetoin utilization deacetylase AcuC-like enzyme